MAGEVIGVNTAIYTGSRGFEGVGFALPSNTVIGVYNQLVTAGKVTRGSIGITFQEDRSNNSVLMKELGAPYGIVVEAVEPGSPAEKAGLAGGRRDHDGKRAGRAYRRGPGESDRADDRSGSRWKCSMCGTRTAKSLSLTVADRSKLFPGASKVGEEQRRIWRKCRRSLDCTWKT